MERIAIFGLGNVALDCARMLLRGRGRHRQDGHCPACPGGPVKRSTVKHVDIIGRRGPVQVNQ